MAVKIRLMRIGTKKRPFYRVVAVDERKKRTGAYLELLGTYNPLTEPKEIILKQDLIDAWKKKGAVLSDGFLRIIGEAPQRQPRKAKKEKKETPKAQEKQEVSVVEETPKEEVKEEVTPNTEDLQEVKTEETPVEAAPSEEEAPKEESQPETEKTEEEKS